MQQQEVATPAWRQAGERLRARWLRRDQAKEGLTVSPDCALAEYLDVAAEILEQFLHHPVDTDPHRMRAYLLGMRLYNFLGTVLPRHPAYDAHVAAVVMAERNLVRHYVQHMALLIDERVAAAQRRSGPVDVDDLMDTEDQFGNEQQEPEEEHEVSREEPQTPPATPPRRPSPSPPGHRQCAYTQEEPPATTTRSTQKAVKVLRSRSASPRRRSDSPSPARGRAAAPPPANRPPLHPRTSTPTRQQRKEKETRRRRQRSPSPGPRPPRSSSPELSQRSKRSLYSMSTLTGNSESTRSEQPSRDPPAAHAAPVLIDPVVEQPRTLQAIEESLHVIHANMSKAQQQLQDQQLKPCSQSAPRQERENNENASYNTRLSNSLLATSSSSSSSVENLRTRRQQRQQRRRKVWQSRQSSNNSRFLPPQALLNLSGEGDDEDDGILDTDFEHAAGTMPRRRHPSEYYSSSKNCPPALPTDKSTPWFAVLADLVATTMTSSAAGEVAEQEELDKSPTVASSLAPPPSGSWFDVGAEQQKHPERVVNPFAPPVDTISIRRKKKKKKKQQREQLKQQQKQLQSKPSPTKTDEHCPLCGKDTDKKNLGVKKHYIPSLFQPQKDHKASWQEQEKLRQKQQSLQERNIDLEIMPAGETSREEEMSAEEGVEVDRIEPVRNPSPKRSRRNKRKDFASQQEQLEMLDRLASLPYDGGVEVEEEKKEDDCHYHKPEYKEAPVEVTLPVHLQTARRTEPKSAEAKYVSPNPKRRHRRSVTPTVAHLSRYSPNRNRGRSAVTKSRTKTHYEPPPPLHGRRNDPSCHSRSRSTTRATSRTSRSPDRARSSSCRLDPRGTRGGGATRTIRRKQQLQPRVRIYCTVGGDPSAEF